MIERSVKFRMRTKTTSLRNCPVGLFMFNNELCVKTEYGSNEGRIDAYIVRTGEFFWGGKVEPEEQAALRVTPVTLCL